MVLADRCDAMELLNSCLQREEGEEWEDREGRRKWMRQRSVTSRAEQKKGEEFEVNDVERMGRRGMTERVKRITVAINKRLRNTLGYRVRIRKSSMHVRTTVISNESAG
jgi:hypothetical protein